MSPHSKKTLLESFCDELECFPPACVGFIQALQAGMFLFSISIIFPKYVTDTYMVPAAISSYCETPEKWASYFDVIWTFHISLRDPALAWTYNSHIYQFKCVDSSSDLWILPGFNGSCNFLKMTHTHTHNQYPSLHLYSAESHGGGVHELI